MSKFDLNFTNKLRSWLDDENRDYAQGALLLLQLRGNHIEFRKLSANPETYKTYIFSNIKKFYDFRAANISHEQVMSKVDSAVKAAKSSLDDKKIDLDEGRRSGRRADHDMLPDDIKKLPDENKDLILRIADLHRNLVSIIDSKADCKDADLLPFAEEIIRLDKKRLANWKKYDHFSLSQS